MHGRATWASNGNRAKINPRGSAGSSGGIWTRAECEICKRNVRRQELLPNQGHGLRNVDQVNVSVGHRRLKSHKAGETGNDLIAGSKCRHKAGQPAAASLVCCVLRIEAENILVKEAGRTTLPAGFQEARATDSRKALRKTVMGGRRVQKLLTIRRPRTSQLKLGAFRISNFAEIAIRGT